MNTALKECKITGQLAYDGSFLKIQRDTVCLPDGSHAIREYIQHPGAVVILPLFDDGSVLLERQFRYALDRVFIEYPAGKIEADEDPLTCAQRELQEETGYTATDWQFVAVIHNAIAYSNEYLKIYLARGLQQGESHLDTGEFLEVFKLPLPELLNLVRTGQVTDIKTIIGTFWLEKIVQGVWQTPSKENE